MVRVPRRRSLYARIEALESRALLNADPGMWPLANPTPANSLLVRFADHAPEAAIRGVVAGVGGYLGSPSPDGPGRLVLGSGLDPASAAASLRGNPFVAYAEVDAIVRAAATTPNDPSFGSEWGLDQSNDVDLDAPAAWDISTGSSAVTVAVTDTGLDYTHPDLYLNVRLNPGEIPAATKAALIDTNGDGRLDFYDLNSLDANRQVVPGASGAPVNAWSASDRNGNGYIDAGDLLADPGWMDGKDNDGDGYVNDIVGWNYVANTNDPYDDNSHGTHVAGTIAALANNGIGVAGVAGNARILPMKFMDSTGSGYVSNAISAINYAAKLGARVINASWGPTSALQALSDAIANAGAKGSVFVAAAGNNASDNDATPFYPASFRLSNEIGVAAVTSSGALASFSDYGATTVDVGAPGQSVYSTMPGGGYAYKSGTSMAAPHVAGVAALLAGQHPEYTADQLVRVIVSASKPLASLAGKTVAGGLVDAYNALTAPPPPPPVLAAPANLTAAAASAASIQLNWTGVSGATGYKLERSPDGATGWAQVVAPAAGTTSYLDTGLASSTTYSYRVLATYPAGDSPYSKVASAATGLAAPTNLTATAASSSSIQLRWSGVAGATGYKVQRSPDGSTGWTQVGTAAATATSFLDPGLAANTAYSYRVVVSASSGDSAPGNVATARTASAAGKKK